MNRRDYKTQTISSSDFSNFPHIDNEGWSGLTILRQSWQTKTQFLFSWIRTLNRVSCWREHWWHDFITRTWIPILHLSFHYWEMRSEKPLESHSPTIPSLSDPSWDHERVSTSPVQTHIEIDSGSSSIKLIMQRIVLLISSSSES